MRSDHEFTWYNESTCTRKIGISCPDACRSEVKMNILRTLRVLHLSCNSLSLFSDVAVYDNQVIWHTLWQISYFAVASVGSQHTCSCEHLNVFLIVIKGVIYGLMLPAIAYPLEQNTLFQYFLRKVGKLNLKAIGQIDWTFL